MNACFIIDNPATKVHPVIGKVMEHLGEQHNVRLLDVNRRTAEEAIAEEDAQPLADIYLLKSHHPASLNVAHHLEQRGALVVNSWASSFACHDRVLMSQRLAEADLPCPLTWSFLPAQAGTDLSWLPYPLMIKSRYSFRGDVVAKVTGVRQLQALVQDRQHVPFILQEHVQGDGSDVKLWVIADKVFAARRPTPLEAGAGKEDVPILEEHLPGPWRSMALAIGFVFNLHFYGVDLLITKRGPVIVDVNSFPGFRGVPGADDALVSLIERLASGARSNDSTWPVTTV